MELSLTGTFVPGSESDVELSLPGTFVPRNFHSHSQRNVVSLPNTNYDYLVVKLMVLRRYSFIVRIFMQLHCSKRWQDLANYFITNLS